MMIWYTVVNIVQPGGGMDTYSVERDNVSEYTAVVKDVH